MKIERYIDIEKERMFVKILISLTSYGKIAYSIRKNDEK